MAKKNKKPPTDETKRDRFKRIVQPRVSKALKAIWLISNCSGSAYEYTEDDVALITTALRAAVDAIEKSYASKGVATIDFALS